MKRKTNLTFILIASLLLITGLSAPAAAQSVTQCTVATSSGNLNVRTYGGRRIGHLRKGEVVYLINWTGDGRANVSRRQEGYSMGYVAARYLSCREIGNPVETDDKASDKEVLWDFRKESEYKEQTISQLETDTVLRYLFGSKSPNDSNITSRATGSFTRPNSSQTLYYVGGCETDDGEFQANEHCGHCCTDSAGWVAVYEGLTPVIKIKVAGLNNIVKLTDLNGDGINEILSVSGYSGMGETTAGAELGQISVANYKKIFPSGEDFHLGLYELTKFSENENEDDKCTGVATVISYVPTTNGRFPLFSEEYFKSPDCHSNWTKITKAQFDAARDAS